jgi:hypothetical protein
MGTPQQWQRALKPDPGVLELLESLTDAARKGHLRALAVVAINPLLELETAHAGTLDNVKRHLLIGGLTEAAQKLTTIL